MTHADDEVAAVAGRRPRRADAQRNCEKIIAAARETFAEGGVSASLEEIARRAGVGIGTLYRNFPTRRDLFETVYRTEVEVLCQAAGELSERPPWEALDGWLRRFATYAVTKRAIIEALNHESAVFEGCRNAIINCGEPLLRRAQVAGQARQDVTFEDVVRLVGGITMGQFSDPDQLDRVLGMALDGLRARPD